MTKNILRIDASMRKVGSHSRSLTNKLINQLAKNQNCKVVIRDLSEGVPLIDENWIKANFTDAKKRTIDQSTCLLKSDVLIDELNSADTIIIGMPIYNFGVPAAFKAWIDQVVRAKLTFKYTDNGPIGLLKNKKTYIIIASGGTQLGSNVDFISTYLRHILGFVGITNITFIDSSGLGRDEKKVLARNHELIGQI